MSEMVEGEHASTRWDLLHWSQCHKFLASQTSCVLPVGDVMLRFFLHPLQKSFPTDGGNKIRTVDYYSLWVEVMSDQTSVLMTISTRLKGRYPHNQGQYKEVKFNSQVILERPTSACDAKVLVEEHFICLKSSVIDLENPETPAKLHPASFHYSTWTPSFLVYIDVVMYHYPGAGSDAAATYASNSKAGVTSKSETIGTDLLSLYDNQDTEMFHDIHLKMKDGILLPAHRFILAARSPVFRCMFSSGMKESQETTIEIPDIGSEAMKVILKFMYSGKIDDGWRTCVEEVVDGASMYNLQPLLNYFDDNLINICDTSNAKELYKLAKLYEMTTAMSLLTEFTRAQTAEVLLSNNTD